MFSIGKKRQAYKVKLREQGVLIISFCVICFLFISNVNFVSGPMASNLTLRPGCQGLEVVKDYKKRIFESCPSGLQTKLPSGSKLLRIKEQSFIFPNV